MATPGGAAGDRLGREGGRQAEPFRPAAPQQHGEAEHQQDCDFQAHEHAPGPGRPSSMFRDPSTCTPAMVTMASSHQGTLIPADAEEPRERRAVQPVHRRLDRAVGQQRQPRRPGADLAPKGGRDIGVEGAVGLDLAAHRDESDGEDHDDDADHQIRARGAGAVAEGRSQRRLPRRFRSAAPARTGQRRECP